MKSSGTWRLFLGAIAMFAGIYLFDRDKEPEQISLQTTVLGGITAQDITSVEYRNMSNQVMRAERTNTTWRLTSPLYPAQVTPIEAFLKSLTTLPKLEVISPSESTGRLKEFGLDPAVATISLNVGTHRHQLQIGGRTPIGENIYVQMAGSAEVLVTDAGLLKALPMSVDQWRSPMLANLHGRKFDHLQIRSGQRLLEFERDATNQIWRISKPTPARANNEAILQLLQRVTTTEVKQFVTDLPVVDLERYGLQTPALELSFLLDTNRVTSFEFGSSPTNDPSLVYVRRMMHTNIVTVPKELLESLSRPYKEFHDPRLISFDPNRVSLIRVNGTNGFAVARVTNEVWRVTQPAEMPADAELMRHFLNTISGMQIVDFAKDVPSDADLKQFGLAPPQISVGLFGAFTNLAGAVTNALMSELSFGGNKTEDTIYARRSDEIPAYVTPAADLMFLPRFGWQLRDRRVFQFAPTNVVAMGYASGSSTNTGARNPGGWTSDPIQNGIIEESLFRIGAMVTRRWVSKGSAGLGNYGLSGASPRLELGIARDGTNRAVTIWFGKRMVRNNIYAATILPGETEPTVFEFPGDVYDLLAQAGLMPAQ